MLIYDAAGTGRSYDGEGRRVRKEVAGQATTVFVYDAFGQLAAEYGPADATQNEYGDYNVHFDVTVVKGESKNEKGILTPVSGLDKGAINVGVLDSNQIGSSAASGKSGISGGVALTLLNFNNLNRDTLQHEIGHHLAGDTARQLPNLGPVVSQIVGFGLNTAADIRTDTIRMTQFGPRPIPTPGFPTNYGMFNRGARRFATR